MNGENSGSLYVHLWDLRNTKIIGLIGNRMTETCLIIYKEEKKNLKFWGILDGRKFVSQTKTGFRGVIKGGKIWSNE